MNSALLRKYYLKQILILIFIFLILTNPISCTAVKIENNSSIYEQSWWKVDPQDQSKFSGYKKLMLEVNLSPKLKEFIKNNGSPDYIYVNDLWRLYLIYLNDNKYYLWDTHSRGKGELIQTLPLSGLKETPKLPNEITQAIFSQHNQLFESFKSELFGYKIDLKDASCWKWQNFEKKFPEAETAVYCGKDTAAIIVPIFYDGEKPHLTAVMQVLLQIVGIDYPSQKIKDLKEILSYGMEGYQLNYLYETDKAEYVCHVRVLSSDNCGYLIAIWDQKDSPELQNRSKLLFDSVHFVPDEVKAFDWKKIDVRQKESHAKHYNSFGLYYYNSKDYHKALDYFKRSVRLNSDDASYLSNLISSYANLEQYKAALESITQYLKNHKKEQNIQVWQAWLLGKTNNTDKAIEIYKELFSKNYRNEDDFADYIRYMQSKQRWQEIDKALQAYFQGGDSIKLRLLQANTLYLQGLYKEAIRLLNEQQANIPFNTEIAYALIHNFNAMGDYKNALATTDSLIKKGFASADSYYLKGCTEFNLRWYKEAKVSFEKALQYTPQDEVIQKFIKHTSALLGEGKNSSIKEQIQPVALPKILLEKIQALKKISNIYETNRPDKMEVCDSYYLYRTKCISFIKGKELKHTTYDSVKVLDMGGVSRFSTIEVDFDPLSEKIYVNHLIIKNDRGDIVARGNPSDYYIIDKQAEEMATFDQTLNIPVPSLLPGYTIELAVTVEQSSHPSEFYFDKTNLAASRPILLSSLYFTGDIRNIRYISRNISSPAKISDGLIWMAENTLVYQWEPYEKNYENFIPLVLIADAGMNWNDIGKGYLKNIEEKLSLDEKIRNLAKQLVKGEQNKEKQIQILAQHVQSSYTYKAIEFGRRARIPNAASVTTVNKYGDCKDHALLLHQLLKAVSVPSYLALTNTKSEIDLSLPSLDQFNHVILYIPTQKGGRFIDTTCKDLNITIDPPIALAGKNALVMDPADLRFMQISPYLSENCSILVQRKINMVNTNDIRIKEDVELFGYFAAFMRYDLKAIDPHNHLKWGQRFVSKYQDSAEIEAFKVENLFNSGENLKIHIEYLVKNQCQLIESKTVLNLPGVWENYYLISPFVKKRITPFEIRYPLKFESQVLLDVPSNYSPISSILEKKSDKNAFCSWQIFVDSSARQQRLKLSCQLKQGTFKPEDYSTFQSMMNQIYRMVARQFMYSVR